MIAPSLFPASTPPTPPLRGKGSRCLRIRQRFYALDEEGRRCLDRNMRGGMGFADALRVACDDVAIREGAAR